MFPFFYIGKNFFGTLNYFIRNARKPCNLYSITPIRTAFDQLSQKNYFVIPFIYGNIIIFYPGFYMCKFC